MKLEQVLIAACCFAFGAMLAKNWRSLFGDDRRIFSRMFWHYGSIFGERLGAAVDRRMLAEQIDRRIFWAIVIALCITAGLAVADVIAAPPAYAFGMAIIVFGLTLQTLTTKRDGVYRVALLEPRDPARIVPLWLFVLPAIVWILGSYEALRLHALVATIIALIASIGAFYASYVIAAAPALISRIDPVMDGIVDMKIRAYRMRFVLFVGALAPLMLAVMVNHNDWGRIALVAAVLALGWWSKLQSDFTASEVATILTSEPAQ